MVSSLQLLRAKRPGRRPSPLPGAVAPVTVPTVSGGPGEVQPCGLALTSGTGKKVTETRFPSAPAAWAQHCDVDFPSFRKSFLNSKRP